MSVYQCLMCRKYYGEHSNKKVNKYLKPINGKTHHRYLDSDTWRCPHCNSIQDRRDFQPFLGTRGNGMVRQLSEEDIRVEFLGRFDDRRFWDEF